MKNSSTCIFYLMIAFCIIFAASCGDSSTDPDPDGPGGGGGVDFGEVSFTVTGDMQGSFTGTAFFEYYDDDSWDLFMSDVLEVGLSNTTFNLGFFTFTEEADYRPGQGTYTVRGHTLNEIIEGHAPGIFPASFEYFEDGFDPEGGVPYGTYGSTNACTFPEHGGTLTITASSAAEIRGSFEMTLLNTDQGASCTALGEVHIEGEFRAVNADDLE